MTHAVEEAHSDDAWVAEMLRQARTPPSQEEVMAELQRLVDELGRPPNPRLPDPRLQEALACMRHATYGGRPREAVNGAGHVRDNTVPSQSNRNADAPSDKNVPSEERPVAWPQADLIDKNVPEARLGHPDETADIGKNVPFEAPVAKQEATNSPCAASVSAFRRAPEELPSVVGEEEVSEEDSQRTNESWFGSEREDGLRARDAGLATAEGEAQWLEPIPMTGVLGSPRWKCVRNNGSFRYYELRAKGSRGRFRVLRRAFRGGNFGEDPLPPATRPCPPPPRTTINAETTAAIESLRAAVASTPATEKLPRWRDLNDVGRFFWWQKGIEGPSHAFTLNMSHHVRREALAHPEGFTRSFMKKLAKNLKRALNRDVQVCFAVDPQNSRGRFKPHLHGFLGITEGEVAIAKEVLRRIVEHRAPMKFRDYLVDIRPAYETANWASYCLKDYKPEAFEWLKGQRIACTSSLKKPAKNAYERYRADSAAGCRAK